MSILLIDIYYRPNYINISYFFPKKSNHLFLFLIFKPLALSLLTNRKEHAIFLNTFDLKVKAIKFKRNRMELQINGVFKYTQRVCSKRWRTQTNFIYSRLYRSTDLTTYDY